MDIPQAWSVTGKALKKDLAQHEWDESPIKGTSILNFLSKGLQSL